VPLPPWYFRGREGVATWQVGVWCSNSRLLCCAVLCCAVLCCAVLCCAVLCCAVLCCAVLCCAVLCCAVLCVASHRYVCVCVCVSQGRVHLAHIIPHHARTTHHTHTHTKRTHHAGARAAAADPV
jgi:hypothetical protein